MEIKISERQQEASSKEQDHNNEHQHKDFVDILLSQLNRPITSPQDHDGHVHAHVLGPSCCGIHSHEAIGSERLVEEKDLSKLSYLDMVIKESLRLHPVSPFINRQAPSDKDVCENLTINGYSTPKHAQVIINVWAT
ncbi:Cytochrome P450 76C3 [Morus notabilis]|uniref:Cytochrome P450 76C3 n=1 Tax=Morus notabilis TaxID=981085 RepID=W9SE18_9ROSA|nr:Cytochrome P450 76C3 [Morus notabilis]